MQLRDQSGDAIAFEKIEEGYVVRWRELCNLLQVKYRWTQTHLGVAKIAKELAGISHIILC